MTNLRLVLLSAVIACLSGVTAGVRAQQKEVPSDQPNNASYPCVVISGAVLTPARVELHRHVRLSELIAAAGGLADYAGRTLRIIHRADDSGCRELTLKEKAADATVLNLDDVFRGGEESNPVLQPGDVVLVSEAERVYVVGNVAKPQALTLKPTMTLTQAIALSGGVRPDSRTGKVKLIRGTSGSSTRTEITVDLKAIRKHQAADLVLQPNDIIDVPFQGHTDGGRPDLFFIVSQQLPLRVIN